MTPLARLLRREIAANGPMPVARFMAAALGHPQFGYYAGAAAASEEPLGRDGDFITAPEISQVFGELLAVWCLAVWRAMGEPWPLSLVELGPGRGTLLADLWRTVAMLAGDFVGALRLHLVETSAALRARQRATLGGLSPLPPLFWHEHIDEVPPGPALTIANEFLDALPVEQYVRDAGVWRERCVSVEGADFVFGLGTAVDPQSRPDLAGLPEAADGTLIERCPAAEHLVATLAGRLAKDGGAALVIDYGPARSAPGETLQAVRSHRPEQPLADPGAVDLSHHVDFERLAQAATAAGAQVWGPVPQGLFLGRLGIAERAAALAAASPEQADTLEGAIRRLVHPGRMGLLFKALAIGQAALPPPPGFARNR
ncbi:MAG: SAM-dependent methyltransferase [Rhodospirillales bacterium]